MPSVQQSDLSVLHIGAGRYDPHDAGHPTLAIWHELAKGFRRYTVVGRSIHANGARVTAGDVAIRLLASRTASEAEFLVTQFRAIRIAEEVNAEVVVTQCPVQGGLAAARIARRQRAKVLMEFHMSHYFEEKLHLSRSNILEYFTRRSLPYAHRIRVLSEGMRQNLLTTYGPEYSDRVVVLPPRVDLSCFSAVKPHWKIVGRPKVVMVGSVNQRKGQLRFLEAVFSGNLDIEVWIAGTGPEMQSCMEYVAHVGKSGQVKFLGQLPHAKLAELLPTADVQVMFSNMEGTPRAIMEGMAVGLPIITTNAGFCADVVKNGVEGFVLGDRPMDEVVICLSQLIDDESLRARMGRAARTRAEKEFDSVKLYERYRALIRETASA